jgi:hypothetical protein
MRRGIGCPPATARPTLANHTLTLHWDRNIGVVEFTVPKLDGGRWHPWKSLVEEAEGWKLGTIYLSEREGKVFATITYERPAKVAKIDKRRKLRVQFGQDQQQFLKLVGPDGASTYDVISARSAVAWLLRALRQRQNIEERKAACGSPRQPWGQRPANRVETAILERKSLLRSRRTAEWNHAWTRRIVARALSWRCGTIQLGEVPEDLFGQPWQWRQFLNDLRYKAEEDQGIVVQTEGS